MATPHVTAAAAVVLAKRPGLDGKGMKDHLQASAGRLPGMGRRRFTEELGAGLLNLEAALS
jgi:subtilisin family serine protease